VAPVRHLRWWIASLLAIATALNYLDRQSLPVVVGEIQKEIPISDAQFGELQSLFLLAYGTMYAVGGRLIDRLGTRAGYALMIVWWSTAALLQGAVSSVLGLGVFRFLLGMGEGGGFPGSAKAVSEWFPPKERSLACGIFNSGSSVGAVIAPPLIALIVLHLNWHWVFWLTGAAGYAWALAWWRLYDLPQNHRRLAPEERAHIADGLAANPVPAAESAASLRGWGQLLRFRQVWGLLIAKHLSDAAWFFYIFWLPKYLGDVRGLNLKQIGAYAWIPYAFSGAGCLLGGWLSGALVHRGKSLDHARKIALATGAALMPLSLLIVSAPLHLALLLFSLAMFGHQFWSTIMQTLPADLVPSRLVGSVAGLAGAAGAFGGMFFSYAVGHLIAHHGYAPAFIIAGTLHPVALLFILFLTRKIERIV